jgi:polygalacturonase
MISVKKFLPESNDPLAITEGFQLAIDLASKESDDGVVIVPPGKYSVCMLRLRSRVTLHLCPGAVLIACPDLDLYPQLPRGHNKDRQPFHLIYAEDCEDICISGQGVIDGNGPAFWSGLVYPDMPWIKANPRRISPLIEIRNCRNVVLKDFTINDSPGWTVHPFNCDHVRIEGVTINNHMYGPNTDGIDINGCRYVFLSNCRIHGCDDNIIIKATPDARASEYITITNCVLESNCAAIGLGAETTSGIRHVTVSNCTVINAIRVIQIILWSGGTVENIAISNITGRALTPIGTDRVIHFDIQNFDQSTKTDVPPERSGVLRNVVVSNVICETRGRILLTAREGARMENITLRDIQLIYPEVEDPAVSIPKSRSNQLSNFNPEARVARAAVVADNISNLVLDNISTTWPADPAVPMHALWARKVSRSRVNCPGLTSSQPGIAPFELIDSEIVTA